MRRLFVTVWCALLMVATICGPARSADSTFKITDYIPEKFEDFEWQVGGSADLSGNDVDNEEYNPWEGLLYQYTHAENNRWNMRFKSYLSYDYETVPQFLNFDMYLTADLSSSESESSRNSNTSTYPGTGGVSYSKGDSWSHRTSLRPSVDAGKYLVGDLFVSGTFSGDFAYWESPDGEAYSRSATLSFNDPFFREETRETATAVSSDGRRYGITVGVLPGWGRIYAGIYASTAIYIIEELKENGVLLREPDKDEMLRLSDLVYQNRLRHAIDVRLRRIETFDEILGYLENAGITDTQSNRGYLYLQDVWDYFPRDLRQFGWRARAGLRLEHYLGRNRWSEDRREDRLSVEYDLNILDVVDTLYNTTTDIYSYHNSEEERRSLYALASFEYGYPLSRRWQLSVDGTVRFSLDGDLTERRGRVIWIRNDSTAYLQTASSEQSLETDNSYDISLASTLSYIYNSRTRLDFSAFCRCLWETTEITRYGDEGEKISSEYSEEGDIALSLETTLTYRLSIPTTLSVTATYYYGSPSTNRYDNGGDTFAAVSDDGSSNSQRYALSVSLNHYVY